MANRGEVVENLWITLVVGWSGDKSILYHNLGVIFCSLFVLVSITP